MRMKPLKRAHTKSRKGCTECKRRRIKCDEKEPRCTNCVGRDMNCHFLRPAFLQHTSSAQNICSTSSASIAISAWVNPTTSSEKSTSQFHDPRSNATTLNNPMVDSEVRLRELELMHYWCIKTCNSFTAKFGDIFRNYVVKEALKHEHLMMSILALTSLHIASEIFDPTVARSYVSTALQFHTDAISTLRQSLESISASNCDAIFVSSVITMACTIVSPLLPVGHNESPKSPTEAILLLSDLIKGIRSIIDISRPWLLGGPLGDIFGLRGRVGLIEETVLAIEHLQHLNDTVVGATHHSHEINNVAIRLLERNINGDVSALSWLAMMDQAFIDEFRKGESMSVAIFMHWGVVLDRLEDMWWAKYAGKRLVKGLSANLKGRGSEWEDAIRWCQIQVQL